MTKIGSPPLLFALARFGTCGSLAQKQKRKPEKISKKGKAKATLATIPPKIQLNHLYSKCVGTTADMMKQFFCVHE